MPVDKHGLFCGQILVTNRTLCVCGRYKMVSEEWVECFSSINTLFTPLKVFFLSEAYLAMAL